MGKIVLTGDEIEDLRKALLYFINTFDGTAHQSGSVSNCDFMLKALRRTDEVILIRNG